MADRFRERAVWPALCAPSNCVCCLGGTDTDPTGWCSKVNAASWWANICSKAARDDPVYTLARAVVLLSSRLAAAVKINPNPRSAWSLLRAAGQGGHPEALYRLGFLAQTGFSGHRIDSELASSCYEAAALLGHSKAQFNYGMLLVNSLCSTRADCVDGVRWVQKAASQGLPQALSVLGILRLCGTVKHIPNDVQEGYDLLVLAWSKGEATAACNLGFFYLVRGGKHVVKARRWFARAAKHNMPEAIFRLANMHWTGLGVDEIDRVTACGLWHQAVLLGHEEAGQKLKCFLEHAETLKHGEMASFFSEVDRDVTEPRLQCWCCGRRKPLSAYSKTQRARSKMKPRCIQCTVVTK